MPQTLLKRLALPAAAAALCGCMTMGRPFDIGRVPTIQLDKTREQDLKSMFGEPYRVGVEDGLATATWVNYHLSVFGGQETRDLYVKFNADDTVKSYSFNSNVPEDQARLKK